MPRLTLFLIALIAILGFAVAYVAVRPMPQAGVTESEVRSIIDRALASAPAPMTDESVRGLIAAALAERDAKLPQSHGAIDAATLNPMIEDYLLSNPSILQRVSEALDRELRVARAEQARAAIAANEALIFEDPDDVVLGNPAGDVTLVELFDYNCSYCRQALPDLATLIAEDPNLRVILKEFPILSEESVDAARIAVLVAGMDADYWAFHQKLFTSRGRVSRETALAAAGELGLDPGRLERDMETPEVTAVLDETYSLATALSVSGTPTFILGDEIIPGAVGLEALRERIDNMRACGSTVCEAESAAAVSEATTGNPG
jgi:protein-disulfide isomerase